MKNTKSEIVSIRSPRQERARQKVELILEASMQLLAKGGFALLTTNAVAERAGVSIGTLYQYFPNKEAILDALADREMADLSHRVLEVLKEPGAITPRERIARVVRAVMAGYGGRPQVHRLVMEDSFRRGGARLVPLIQELVGFLSSTGPLAGDGQAVKLSHAEAFVMTNAFAGVMRAMILWQDNSAPPQGEVEEALAHMIVHFAGERTEGG